jgi:hypothetical protein
VQHCRNGLYGGAHVEALRRLGITVHGILSSDLQKGIRINSELGLKRFTAPLVTSAQTPMLMLFTSAHPITCIILWQKPLSWQESM